MTSLATVHGTAFAYQTEVGGKATMLSKYPVLTEDSFPRSKLIKVKIGKKTKIDGFGSSETVNLCVAHASIHHLSLLPQV